MASTGSKGLRRLGLLATGLGLAVVAVKARRESRALVGTWAELSGLEAAVEDAVVEPVAEPLIEFEPEPIVEVAPEAVVDDAPEPVVDVAPEPVVEVAPEPVVELTPEPVVELAPETSQDVLPPQLPWEMRAKVRFEALMEATLHYRRALIAVLAVALAVVLLIAVPALVRTRHTASWERCVERTTGTTLPKGARVTRVVLDSCGPKPAFNTVPADRRN